MTTPDVATPDGRAWLRETVLGYIERRQGVTEDRILQHVDGAAGEDYEGDGPSFAAVDLLFRLVREGALSWHEQRGKPDAPLRYFRLRGPLRLAASGARL